ncbi:MAG: glycosyltransferase [Kiritimatiellae bacterium]|jgi:glycosyltransferase involved in cell wall biosynthesis|nr:glycosyltransferase [Kiritimatiellia bacterium]NLD89682.1 glycosyltransferase [Lentisphaerota bacterium]HPC19282.1 glycosyltransferase family 2 protein [Kiritimatiellia bacterium]HQN79547.1 glycosyltransferase family 2 protein [Kiritimatiellia bacterium]
MKISILTVNRNGARWLARCMDSVLAQELAPGDELEYLFLDGGSTDGSLSIAEVRRDHLAALVSEPDNGPAEALNKGFRLVTGDLIGWLNADDVYGPGTLARALTVAKAHPSAGFFFGPCRIVNEAGREIRRFPTLVKNSCFPFSSRFLLQCINYVSQPASWFRRAALEAAGGGLRTDLKAAWDYDLMLRLWRQGGGVRIPGGPLADFQWHPASIGGTHYERQFAEEWKLAAADAGRFSPQAAIHWGVWRGIVACYRLMNRRA